MPTESTENVENDLKLNQVERPPQRTGKFERIKRKEKAEKLDVGMKTETEKSEEKFEKSPRSSLKPRIGGDTTRLYQSFNYAMYNKRIKEGTNYLN